MLTFQTVDNTNLSGKDFFTMRNWINTNVSAAIKPYFLLKTSGSNVKNINIDNIAVAEVFAKTAPCKKNVVERKKKLNK